MKNKYVLIFILLITSSKVSGQQFRVFNSFIITLNGKVTSSIESVKFTLCDTAGKREIIEGGYFPGGLFVPTIESKNLLMNGNLQTLLLEFTAYENKGDRLLHKNYAVKLDKQWLGASYIILKISDKKKGKYGFSLEVPGFVFAIDR